MAARLISLGKITVPTPGTPVQITVAMIQTALTAAGVNPNELQSNLIVNNLTFNVDATDTGRTSVKVGKPGAWVTAKSMLQASGGFCDSYETPEVDGNAYDPTAFAVDAQNANQGPFVVVVIV